MSVKKRITITIIGLVLMLFMALAYAGTIVRDPQQDYLETKLVFLYQGDVIYKITLDLNEDGVDDYFFSSSDVDDQVSRRGTLAWTVYLSVPEGGYFKPGFREPGFVQMDLNPNSAYVVRLDNGKIALQYTAFAGQNLGNTYSYIVDENNQLKNTKIWSGQIETRDEPDQENIVKEQVELLQYEVLKLSEILAADQLASTKRIEQDFDYQRDLIGDYYDKRLVYVVFKDPKIGSLDWSLRAKHTAEFLGIKEEGVDKLIPVAVIPESIINIMEKRLRAILKGKLTDSQQETEELQQIQQWFDQWHKQYGSAVEIEPATEDEKRRAWAEHGLDYDKAMEDLKAGKSITYPKPEQVIDATGNH